MNQPTSEQETAEILTEVDAHIGSYMRLCGVLSLDPIGYDSTAAQTKAADEIERLRLANEGGTAMLRDANRVIADLREKGEENIRLGRENAQLRADLGAERASHCVCKCDDGGESHAQGSRERARCATRGVAAVRGRVPDGQRHSRDVRMAAV